MEANQKSPVFVSKRKYKMKRDRKKLLVGEKVEVRSSEDGFLGSWHHGSVTALEKYARRVRYDHLLSDNGEDSLVDKVSVSKFIEGIRVTNHARPDGYRGSIRPPPPKLALEKHELRYGLCVDVYHVEAWWEGVIIGGHGDGDGDESDERKIFFPDLGDVMSVGIDSLRVSQDWDEISDAWRRRGTWLFLELIEEYEKERFVPVSVEQLWYDVRVKSSFYEIAEWTCRSKRSLWEDLLLEVIQDNLVLTIEHFLRGLGVTLSPQLENEPSSKISVERYDHDASRADERESVSCHSEAECERPRSSLASPSGTRREPVDSMIDPEPRFCPKAIPLYVKKASGERAMDVRKHLKYMGWSMERTSDQKRYKIRYTSPDGKQTEHSLRRICCQLMENEEKRDSPVLVNDTEEICKPSLPSSLSDSENGGEDIDLVVDALEAYLKVKNPRCVKKDPKTLALKERAKTYLHANGWKFTKKVCGRRCVSEYTSPRGDCIVYTLKAACRKYLEKYRPLRNADGTETIAGCNETGEVQETRDLRRKRKRDSPSFRCNSAPPKISTEFRGKKSTDSAETGRCHGGKKGKTRVFEARKRPIQVASPPSTCRDPRTVLSWLIDNNGIPPGGNVYCDGSDCVTRKEGVIAREGIKCVCCSEVFTISGFALHAGNERQRPAAAIFFLEGGRSLLDCQMEANGARESAETYDVSRRNWFQGVNDDVCSVCLYGGDLLLCDGCPSAYHKSCVGLEDVPDNDWFCPTCFCGICGKVNLTEDIGHSKGNLFIHCHQCERKCHVCCLPNQGADNMSEKDKRVNWFCGDGCKEIFENLQKLIGTQTVVGSERLTWTMMKTPKSGMSELDPSEVEACAEIESKLNVAVGVVHECFEPVEEAQSRGDTVKDVIFSRSSKLRRLNFGGFYTILLERNDELVAVATIRIFGKSAAEIPLIATRFQYRGHGMCRVLMDTLEEKLRGLGVERLVLPSARCVVNTWINSFGFSETTDSERESFLRFTFLNFQDTVMCHKLLLKDPPLPDSISTEKGMSQCSSRNHKRDSKEQEETHVLRCSPSVIPTYYTRRRERDDDTLQ